MIATLIIVFREVLEAGLVVSVVMAATRGVPRRGLYVTVGVLLGVLGASILAAFADQVAHMFQGVGRQLLNAAVLAVAVVMLGWTVIWMSVHGRRVSAELKAVGKDVAEGRKPLTAIAVVVFVAVLREGSEVVLFLYGLLAGGDTSAFQVAIGVVFGILAGAAVCSILYLGLAAIPLKHVFSVIAVLVTLLAAGLAAQAVAQLQGAGWFAAWSQPLWDTEWLLSHHSIPGRILHTLVGYEDKPTAPQLIAYVLTIVVIFLWMRRVERAQHVKRPA
ncbi:MAG: FTR1 family protein [Pseudomonadota bacterium]